MWFQFIVADLSYQLSLCDASLSSQENRRKVIYWISSDGLCHFALTMLQLGMMMMMMMMDAANLQVPVTVGGAEMTSFTQQVLLTPVVTIQQLFSSFAAWKVKKTPAQIVIHLQVCLKLRHHL